MVRVYLLAENQWLGRRFSEVRPFVCHFAELASQSIESKILPLTLSRERCLQ
jgi:hypothetical protein